MAGRRERYEVESLIKLKRWGIELYTSHIEQYSSYGRGSSSSSSSRHYRRPHAPQLLCFMSFTSASSINYPIKLHSYSMHSSTMLLLLWGMKGASAGTTSASGRL